ncbi:MAG: orotidine 5'-phosphate decarboxylase [Candidatus Buchananbacteria bacterium RBG_13_39_9]|uniref:Orotidine 5'-phosphate decarboxylase n=1 Tax=Candidatus Buchananbacteria bacterium RBG_13_39_9 TaxID=1797531 RepID=A0A1G1XPG4_9BACT|nr:MAG: orotidine 5'-phosphate decarboxylase [Candidatus Buchananbacteria bacterium RBG_13_39_9]
MESPKGKERIIVALDVPSLAKAGDLVEKLAPHVGFFKVGLELITAEGAPQVVKFVQERGGKVFFDGKFDDIPNTVGAASKVVSGLGVNMFNVHASCGIDSMFAAVDNRGSSLVLAVTVLTSFEENDGNLCFGGPTKAKVLEFARWAKLAGVDGIICSPQELKLLRSRRELKGLITVIPGTRSAGVAVGDQKRVMTPGEAVIDGADYLVAGRQVTKPEVGDPVEAAIKLGQEIEQVEKEMEEKK